MSSLMPAVARMPAVLGKQLWRSHELSSRDWTSTIPSAVLDELLSFVRAQPAAVDDLEHLDLRQLAWPRTRKLGASVREALQHGAGFHRLSLPEGLGLRPPAARLLYLAIGAALGNPMTQYGRLYAVKDRGADYRASLAPVSMTRERTGFHTDSSARDALPDWVALLCEQPALAGGDSMVSNALRVRAELAEHHPAAMRLLTREYVRDLVTPGLDTDGQALAQNRFPVFARDQSPTGWTFRYMRYWLERGQERSGAPVPPVVKAALDLLDGLLAAPEHVVQLRLATGDMLWVNNRTLAHDRTEFTDDPAAPRLMWRMWISAV